MPRPLNIACLQTRPVPDMEAAIAEALPLAEKAVRGGAEMLFLPEYCGGLKSEGRALNPPAPAEGEHAVLAALKAFAAEHKVWVNIGSIAVAGPGEKIINRGYMVDPGGRVTGSYDKIHMFDVDLSDTAVYRESDTVAPGGAAVLHETPFGAIGHTICYDLRFPDLYRRLAHAGAEILTCPAAFTKVTGQAHWHVLNRARAIENTCFMVSACAVGPVPGGGECYGHSLIVNPWGEVLADGGDGSGVVQTVIDLDEVAAARKRIPSLTHDRDFAMPDAEKRDVA